MGHHRNFNIPVVKGKELTNQKLPAALKKSSDKYSIKSFLDHRGFEDGSASACTGVRVLGRKLPNECDDSSSGEDEWSDDSGTDSISQEELIALYYHLERVEIPALWDKIYRNVCKHVARRNDDAFIVYFCCAMHKLIVVCKTCISWAYVNYVTDTDVPEDNSEREWWSAQIEIQLVSLNESSCQEDSNFMEFWFGLQEDSDLWQVKESHAPANHCRANITKGQLVKLLEEKIASARV